MKLTQFDRELLKEPSVNGFPKSHFRKGQTKYDVAALVALRRSGASTRVIAEKFNVAQSTVSKALKAHDNKY